MDTCSTRVRGFGVGAVARAVLLLIVGPPIAAAQGQAETMTNPPTLLKESLAAPKPGGSTVSVTAGLQLQDGRTETRGWTLSGLAAHTKTNHALVQLQVVTNYASYRAAAHQPYATVEDNQNALFMYMQPVGKHYSWLGSAGWRRDTILELSYRWWGEGGAGITLTDNKRAYALVGASFGAGRERRRYLPGTDPVEDIGVLQIFKWSPTSTMSIEEWVRSKHDVRNRPDYSTSFYISFLAHVTKHAGMKIYYQLDDEGIHPPTSPARQTTLGAGVQISFTRGAAQR